jgi:hypothetical protein
VLDQHGAVSRLTLVIKTESAANTGHGGIGDKTDGG